MSVRAAIDAAASKGYVLRPRYRWPHGWELVDAQGRVEPTYGSIPEILEILDVPVLVPDPGGTQIQAPPMDNVTPITRRFGPMQPEDDFGSATVEFEDYPDDYPPEASGIDA
ncbi:hypothetical protein D5S18_15890 [Nocardia panacis]|uniref:Uncharacterized protein n=1 Tax=Nocardia panacis TaxID=2340916 RepID=A0A3A4KLJ2_9NOCA|nr:hypothetical protein D5S18_15890 [Nocardia panacis]